VAALTTTAPLSCDAVSACDEHEDYCSVSGTLGTCEIEGTVTESGGSFRLVGDELFIDGVKVPH
jgi:hypothetical protein